MALTAEVAFPREEFAARLGAARAGMARAGLDALVASAPENLYYPIGVVARELDGLGLAGARVGVEKSYRFLTVANLERLQALLPGDGEVGIAVSETVIVTASGPEPVGAIPREIVVR